MSGSAADIAAIAYDDTPLPSSLALAAHADLLELPVLDWRVIRQLGGRVAALGTAPGAQEPCWVLKIATTSQDTASLRHGHDWAHRLDKLLPRFSQIASPDAELWRLRIDSNGCAGTLAVPFVAGTPLAPETRLSEGEAKALDADIPTILSVFAAIDDLPDWSAKPNPKEWSSHLRKRFDRHLAALMVGGQLDEAASDELRSTFRRRLAEGSTVFRLAHGEMTPWHILRRPDGRLSLLDLDTMGHEVRHVDLSVAVMRIWALQGAPEVAKRLIAAQLVQMTPRDQSAFERTMVWQWMFAGVRTRHEAQSWPDHGPADDFMAWCLAKI